MNAGNDSCIIKPPHCPSKGYFNRSESRIDTCNLTILNQMFDFYYNEIFFEIFLGLESKDIDSTWKNLDTSLIGMKVFFKELAKKFGDFGIYQFDDYSAINHNSIYFYDYQNVSEIEKYFLSSKSSNVKYLNYVFPSSYLEAFKLNTIMLENNPYPKLKIYTERQQSWCEGGAPEISIYRKLLHDTIFENIGKIQCSPKSSPYELSYKVDTTFIDNSAVLGENYYYQTKAGCAPPSNIVSSLVVTSITNYNESKDLSISPNPASDFIEISYPPLERGSGGVGIKIYNIFGQNCDLTPTLSTSGEGVRIDVSGLSPGMYLVQIGDRVGKFVRRFAF